MKLHLRYNYTRHKNAGWQQRLRSTAMNEFMGDGWDYNDVVKSGGYHTVYR